MYDSLSFSALFAFFFVLDEGNSRLLAVSSLGGVLKVVEMERESGFVCEGREKENFFGDEGFFSSGGLG